MNSYISHTRGLVRPSCMCTCDRTHQSTFIANPHSHGVSLYQPVAIHSVLLFCYRRRVLNSRLYVAIRIAIIFVIMNDEYGYLIVKTSNCPCVQNPMNNILCGFIANGRDIIIVQVSGYKLAKIKKAVTLYSI